MNEIFDVDTSFKAMGLRDSVVRGLEAAGFERPTHIQAALIPLILAGNDVIGQAKTGTGKTAAFGLPILNGADKDVPMQALILVPTRELAAQVSSELKELGQFTPIRTTCIIGGESMRQQTHSVQQGGHIIVGTPGRIMDMQGRRLIHFENVRFAVLDEVDRMLDIGFRDDIRKILSGIKGKHQTVGDDIERLARQFASPDAERVTTTSGALTVSLVDQKLFFVEPWDKSRLLLHLLKHEKPHTTLVFCRTKATVQRLTQFLQKRKVDAREMHGDLHQRRRTKVMDSMREGSLNVLIASDLAARGLDVDHITHVINYDIPEDPEVYVHRIGRTARLGRRGTAWSFASSTDGKLLTEIEKLTGVLIDRQEYAGFDPGPVPDDVQRQRHSDAQRGGDPVEKMKERTKPTAMDSLSEEQQKLMFPDGHVPASAPRRTLGSRLRRRR